MLKIFLERRIFSRKILQIAGGERERKMGECWGRFRDEKIGGNEKYKESRERKLRENRVEWFYSRALNALEFFICSGVRIG